MSTAIAWIAGQWGTAASLQLPLDDRALLLADGLFETVLIRNGAPQLLQEHLQRWSDSAALLGMDPPPQRNALEPLLEDAIQRSQLSEADGALRLNWSRAAHLSAESNCRPQVTTAFGSRSRPAHPHFQPSPPSPVAMSAATPPAA